MLRSHTQQLLDEALNYKLEEISLLQCDPEIKQRFRENAILLRDKFNEASTPEEVELIANRLMTEFLNGK
jgi:hypothetical protein